MTPAVIFISCFKANAAPPWLYFYERQTGICTIFVAVSSHKTQTLQIIDLF